MKLKFKELSKKQKIIMLIAATIILISTTVLGVAFLSNPYVKSLEIIAPTKVEYLYGEELDITGGRLSPVYSDKTVGETIDIEESMVSGFDKNKIGEQEITVTYGKVKGKFTITMSKSSYSVEQLKFEDKVITYDGELQNIEIDGDLPKGVIVSYEGNGQVDVGVYEVTATFTGDAEHYNEVQHKKATLTINKKPVTVNINNRQSEYGTPLVSLTSTVLNNGLANKDSMADLEIKLTKEAGKDVGVYEITGTSNAANYEVTINDGTYEIVRGHYDVSGIRFINEQNGKITMPFDNNSHEIRLDVGTLSTGVSVRDIIIKSSDGATLTTVKNKGTYLVTTRLTGDTVRYNEIPNKVITVVVE